MGDERCPGEEPGRLVVAVDHAHAPVVEGEPDPVDRLGGVAVTAQEDQTIEGNGSGSAGVATPPEVSGAVVTFDSPSPTMAAPIDDGSR